MGNMERSCCTLENGMKTPQILGLVSTLLLPIVCNSTDSDRQAMQEKLDAECEAAREHKLAPERARFIDECVEKQQRADRAACERFYSDYGARSGNRAPLYYDLPECAKAFDFQRSHRRP